MLSLYFCEKQWAALCVITLGLLSITLAGAQTPPEQILLKSYRPRSVYRVPVSQIEKARYPIIDMHSHAYPESPGEIDRWVATMEGAGIQKTVIMSYEIGAAFDSVYALYAGRYPDHFEVWCGFDYRNYHQPDYGLERCVQAGARGVGELGDKGKGLFYSHSAKAWGMHLDDPRMSPLLQKCGELGIPVSIHVAEPIWMYAAMDSTNDGLMNAYDWRLDNQEGIIDHDGMIDILEGAVKKHPETTFIAVHFANLSYDLDKLGDLLDRYPNLYADNAARYAETAPIPRTTAAFYAKYQNRLLYGTDMGVDPEMYHSTFRLLESNDEHFYNIEQFGYHWPLYGLGLNNRILKKVYQTNAQKLMKKRDSKLAQWLKTQ